MVRSGLTTGLAVYLSVAGAHEVIASYSGPVWGENGDAGSLPGGSQTTMGSGRLGGVNGNLGGTPNPFGFDLEDMFLINIVEPMNFRATTDPDDPELRGAFAQFDTELWLFRPVAGAPSIAFGFLGNDNHPGTGLEQSLLIPIPSDGSPRLTEPGLYLIAISRFDNNPESAPGENIFLQQTREEVSGPDGPGGGSPITGWSGDSGMFAGDYQIALRGAEFAVVPGPGGFALLGVGALLLRQRRRKN